MALPLVPQREREWRGTTSMTGHFVGAPRLTAVESVSKRREGLPTTSPRILADGVHACSAQVVTPTSGFAHLQTNTGCTLTRSSAGTDLPDLGPQVRIASPGPQFAHTTPGAKSQPLPLGRVSAWPHLTRGTGESAWKLCNQQ